MKNMFFVLSVAVATVFVGTRAEAQNYPWCSIYGGSMGGSQNCGFSTYQQCMDNVSGIGGFCQLNDWYHPPGGRPCGTSRTRISRSQRRYQSDSCAALQMVLSLKASSAGRSKTTYIAKFHSFSSVSPVTHGTDAEA